MDEAEIRSKYESGTLAKVSPSFPLCLPPANPTAILPNMGVRPGSPQPCSASVLEEPHLLTCFVSTASCRPTEGVYMFYSCDGHASKRLACLVLFHCNERDMPIRQATCRRPRSPGRARGSVGEGA